jgi:hypothetical protein
LGFLYRPLAGGYAPTTRPTSEPSPVLAAKLPVRKDSAALSTNNVTQRDSGLRGRSVAGEPVMESREEEQTVELDVEQGRKSLAQPTCGSARAAQDTES